MTNLVGMEDNKHYWVKMGGKVTIGFFDGADCYVAGGWECPVNDVEVVCEVFVPEEVRGLHLYYARDFRPAK